MSEPGTALTPQSTLPDGEAPLAEPVGLFDLDPATMEVMAAVRRERLAPWMKQFAQWLLSPTHTAYPPIVDQTRKAAELSGLPVHRKALDALKRRGDFRVYYETLEGSALSRAKERLVNDTDYYIHAHRHGLEMAIAAGDHRAVASFTNPILDRVAPKREDAKGQKPQIVIQVTADARARIVEAEETIMDAEIVSTEEAE